MIATGLPNTRHLRSFPNLEKNAGAYNAGNQVQTQKRAIALTDPALLAEYGDGWWPLRWVYEKGKSLLTCTGTLFGVGESGCGSLQGLADQVFHSLTCRAPLVSKTGLFLCAAFGLLVSDPA